MAKKSKTRAAGPAAPDKKPATKKRAEKSGKKKSAPKTPGAAAPARAANKKFTGAKKRADSHLALTLPVARARRLAADLYESAGLAIWAEAIEQAAEPERDLLVALQDAICDAADIMKGAKATNPKHLRLYWVACLDREGLPATPPRFITAASEKEALEIWSDAFKGEGGRRKPRAHVVPILGAAPGLHF